MTTTQSAPDFDQLADLFIVEGAVLFSPSELHGAIVGQIAAGRRLDATALSEFCAAQLDVSQFSHPSSLLQLTALYNQSLSQLEASSFELSLLLPDEEHQLSERAEQLGTWAAGFLAGFGLGASNKANALSAEAQESLKDLVDIAQIDTDSEGEEEEALLFEVEEYVRMVAMLLFTECNKADPDPASELTMH